MQTALNDNSELTVSMVLGPWEHEMTDLRSRKAHGTFLCSTGHFDVVSGAGT